MTGKAAASSSDASDAPVMVHTPDGRSVPVRVKINPRARRIQLRIDTRHREAVAIAPSKSKVPAVLAFASERAAWIAARLDELPDTHALTPGTLAPLRGDMHEIVLAPGGRSVVIDDRTDPPQIQSPGPADKTPARVRGFMKAAARMDLSIRVGVHARTLGVQPASISIKDTRTRWGSCSSAGNLNFSWRLICAPPYVLDYVAAHECAHLLEMNHSRRFWGHVETCIADYDRARTWLNAHGRALHAVGD